MTVIDINSVDSSMRRPLYAPVQHIEPLTVRGVLFPRHPNRHRSSCLLAAVYRADRRIGYFESPETDEFEPYDCMIFRNATTQETAFIQDLLARNVIIEGFGPRGWAFFHQSKKGGV